ncbi:hypothetical protein HAX54_022380, partial [Datura stramonium]|nr:hypothetical protein [Datura stramonium]
MTWELSATHHDSHHESLVVTTTLGYESLLVVLIFHLSELHPMDDHHDSSLETRGHSMTH